MSAFTIPYRLEITDGAETIDLVGGSDGFWLEEWKPATSEYKGGGIFGDSPLVDERRLINRSYSNIVDIFSIQQASASPNTAVLGRRRLRQMLEKAADYQTANWQTSPVYLAVQGVGETNVRYALVVAGQIPATTNPFGPTADYTFGGRSRSNNKFDVVVEHGVWTAHPPETGGDTCLLNGGQFNGQPYGPNHAFINGLDYIYYYNGSYSGNLVDSTLPVILMPSGSSMDELYFGRGQQFGEMQFSLSSGQDGASEMAWEYWDGTSWTQLVISGDKTASGISGTSLYKSGGIYWETPTDWKVSSVNGAVAYWVRMRQLFFPITQNITADAMVTASPPASYCNYIPFVTNHDKFANITDVYYYDNSTATFGDNLAGEHVPYSFHSTSIGINDALFFGISTAVTDAGPFHSLIFNLSDEFAATAWAAKWQYWNGSAWTDLTTSDKTDTLSEAGENGVFWEPPTDWTVRIINGVTGWWIRMSVQTATGVTLPKQQIRHIYTVSWSYVEISETGGDIRALAQLTLRGYGPQFGISAIRVRGGERSVTRGHDFRAWVNTGGYTLQNNIGITVDGTNISFTDDLLSPTGKAATAATGVGVVSSTVVIAFDDTIANEYQGEFRLFVVAKSGQSAPGYEMYYTLCDINEFALFVGDPVVVNIVSTPFYTYMDMGRLSVRGLDAGFCIKISTEATSPTAVLKIIGLYLQPIDEFAFEVVTPSVSLPSGSVVIVDGLGIRNKAGVFNENGKGISSCPITANGTISTQNSVSRFWFAASPTPGWFFPLSFGVSVLTNPRYLEARGDQ